MSRTSRATVAPLRNRLARTAPSVAFTLVELLVTMGILVLLLAVLLPILSHMRQSAAESALRSDERQNTSANVAVAAVAAGQNVRANQADLQPAGTPARPAAHVKRLD